MPNCEPRRNLAFALSTGWCVDRSTISLGHLLWTLALSERFNVHVIHTSDMTTEAQIEFESGYNNRAKEHINSVSGDQCLLDPSKMPDNNMIGIVAGFRRTPPNTTLRIPQEPCLRRFPQVAT